MIDTGAKNAYSVGKASLFWVFPRGRERREARPETTRNGAARPPPGGIRPRTGTPGDRIGANLPRNDTSRGRAPPSFSRRSRPIRCGRSLSVPRTPESCFGVLRAGPPGPQFAGRTRGHASRPRKRVTASLVPAWCRLGAQAGTKSRRRLRAVHTADRCRRPPQFGEPAAPHSGPSHSAGAVAPSPTGSSAVCRGHLARVLTVPSAGAGPRQGCQGYFLTYK